MTRRTNAPRDGARRLTTRLFPLPVRRRESAIAWLSADPVFDELAAARH